MEGGLVQFPISSFSALSLPFDERIVKENQLASQSGFICRRVPLLLDIRKKGGKKKKKNGETIEGSAIDNARTRRLPRFAGAGRRIGSPSSRFTNSTIPPSYW